MPDFNASTPLYQVLQHLAAMSQADRALWLEEAIARGLFLLPTDPPPRQSNLHDRLIGQIATGPIDDPLLAGFVGMAGGVDRAIALLRERKAIGWQTYGRLLTLDTPIDWNRYAIEEWADLLVYLEGDRSIS